MRLLLDTHLFLWWREASTRVTAEARWAIGGADVVFVSAASARHQRFTDRVPVRVGDRRVGEIDLEEVFRRD